MLQSLLIGLSQEKAGNTPEGFLNNVFVLFFFINVNHKKNYNNITSIICVKLENS